jgi:hypothetical protein
MNNLTAQFLEEIDETIKRRQRLELNFKILHVGLGVVVASCGFLTAAASQATMKTTWISTPSALLIFGLLSAMSAIINQLLTPSEKQAHHQNVKRALQYIRGEVKFRSMTVKQAELFRILATTNPELVLGQLNNHESVQKRKKASSPSRV